MPFFQEMQPKGEELGRKLAFGANLGGTLGVYPPLAARIALTQGPDDDKLKERETAVLPDNEGRLPVLWTGDPVTIFSALP